MHPGGHRTEHLQNAVVATDQVEPSEEHLLLSASADNSLPIWDPPKRGPGCEAVATAAHSLTCQSAYFAPDGTPLRMDGWTCFSI